MFVILPVAEVLQKTIPEIFWFFFFIISSSYRPLLLYYFTSCCFRNWSFKLNFQLTHTVGEKQPKRTKGRTSQEFINAHLGNVSILNSSDITVEASTSISRHTFHFCFIGFVSLLACVLLSVLLSECTDVIRDVNFLRCGIWQPLALLWFFPLKKKISNWAASVSVHWACRRMFTVALAAKEFSLLKHFLTDNQPF